MKIIYSPYYSHGTYIASKPGDVHLGEVIVGTRGLLDELELRSGCTRKEATPFERTVAYYNAIKHVLDSGATPFFKESFEKDELGVSGELLRWRDALVMSGCNSFLNCQKLTNPHNTFAEVTFAKVFLCL